MNPLEAAAQDLARRRLRVIPLHHLVEGGKCSCDAWRAEKSLEACRTPGKHPRFKSYAETASIDPGRIGAWWKSDPLSNVGVISGKRSNLIVLDTDPRNGGDWSRGEWIKANGELPRGATCVTGGRGMHEHFLWPETLETDQSVVELAPGLEVLLEGHNVVMPPSFAHVGGDPYFWDVELEEGIPAAPEALVAAIQARLAPKTNGKKPEGNKWPPADIGAILRGCEWMRWSSEHAASLSEPEWYAQLSILGRCENGEQLAQDLSSPYPGYTERATTEKLARALRDTGPATCAKIRHALGSRACESCQAGVKSPIVLGISPGKQSSRRKKAEPTVQAPAPVESAEPEVKEIDGLPRIRVTSRQLRDIAQEALIALQQRNEPAFLFARAGAMVSVRPNEKGRQEIAEVTESALRGHLTRSANYFKIGTSGASSACYPPLEVPRDILSIAPAAWEFQSLDAVVEAPVLRGDGTILDQPGYDGATQLYYAPDSGLNVPPLAEYLTRDHLDVGVELIADLLSEFPFDGDASRANAFAAALTPIIRPAIDAPAPMALFDAPQAGTGKSLLADVISIIATGRPGEMFSAPRDEDEWRKQITTALLSGTSVVVIDNVTRRLDNADLCKVLTETLHVDRAFRTHQKLVLPVKSVWIATGNNIQLGGDMPRRCYRVRLDAQTSRPFMRTGFRHDDLKSWTLAHRGELLAALLTLSRAWYLAGRPKPSITPLGSYEVWSTTVGGILEYAGIKGFLGNAESIYEEADAEAGQWEGFLQTLHEVFYGEPFTVHQLVERIKSKTWNGENTEYCVQATMLREALPDFLAEGIDREGFFQRRAGKAFAERVGRRFGSSQVHLKRGPLTHKVQQWIVVRPEAESGAAKVEAMVEAGG